MKIFPDIQHVKHIGRTASFPDLLLLSLSGSGIEFEYTGKGFDLTLIGGEASKVPDNEANYARVGIYINNTRTQDILVNAERIRLRIGESTESQTITVRIIKLSECAMSLVGIAPLEVANTDTIRPTSPAKLKIEFIGDSITCGYGVDDEDPLHPFKTATEDVTRAYAYKTAKALHADYSMFSISGYGIISGYTADPAVRMDHQLIPTFYHSLGLSYDTLAGIPTPMDIAWDFGVFQPDLVVINLGTNDDSFCQEDPERQQEYQDRYRDFLMTVRKKNPKSIIICVLGLMGQRLYPRIEAAVADYKERTGDTKIHTVLLPEQDPEVGYVSDYHPLESAHEKAAGVLIPKLLELDASAGRNFL